MTDRYTRRYDMMLKDIILTLKEDYAGFPEIWPEYQPNFYITAAGTKHHHNEMYDHLFLQYASQMLATTGDRGLRLSLAEGDDYSPWTPGFFARRLGDRLIVTEVFEESRLCVGDEILKINSEAPDALREKLQKNFFYSYDPEREIWHGLLKMADHILVRGKNGGERDLPLGRYPRRALVRKPEIRDLGGCVYLCPGTLDGGGELEKLINQNEGLLSGCEKLILDLRRCDGHSDEDILLLLPYIVSGKAELAEVLREEPIVTNYTAKNCACAWFPAESWMEANGPDDELSAYVKDLKDKSGAGLLEEPSDLWSGITGELGGKAPDKLIVLTDTFCENSGERLAEIAQKQPGSITIGRPTMGTLDYTNHVSKSLSEGFTLTWPMSKRKSVLAGHGVKGKGLPVDQYIPFTAIEATKDIILKKAIEF